MHEGAEGIQEPREVAEICSLLKEKWDVRWI